VVVDFADGEFVFTGVDGEPRENRGDDVIEGEVVEVA
jgi:hypothetical protein